MGDLKINGITPSGVYFNSSDVQRIYNGGEIVWPTSVGPGEVQVCAAIWKKENSSTLAKVGGGNIDFANTANDWVDAYVNQIPAACYFEFDNSKASYGLIYNYWAKSIIQPPVGFKLPSSADLSNLVQCYGDNDNPLGADPGVWDTSLLTNTTGLGTSGFNAHGYGYAYVEMLNSTVVWTNKGKREVYWASNTNDKTGIEVQFYTNGHLRQVSGLAAENISTFIRFIKDE